MLAFLPEVHIALDMLSFTRRIVPLHNIPVVAATLFSTGIAPLRGDIRIKFQPQLARHHGYLVRGTKGLQITSHRH